MVAFLALIAMAAAAEPVPNPLVGTVENVSATSIEVRSGSRFVTLVKDEATVVWKNGTSRNLSMLHAGEPVRVAWRNGAKPVIVTVSAAARISGTIDHIDGDGLEVRDRSTNEVRVAEIVAGTEFGAGRSRLAVGDEVSVSGWDVGSGRIEAMRVAVYNTDLPARM